MKLLTGHDSPETAYLVEDYPYGFRLRTQIRYWIETKRGHGQRFVSQTLNPKTGRWNKPKASTYSTLLVMGLNSDGHVSQDGVTTYTDSEKLERFAETYAEVLDGNYEREAVRYLRACIRANDRLTVRIVDPSEPGPHQTMEEQAKLYQAVIRDELWRDTIDAIRGTEKEVPA